jgi:hypothetical protein
LFRAGASATIARGVVACCCAAGAGGEGWVLQLVVSTTFPTIAVGWCPRKKVTLCFRCGKGRPGSTAAAAAAAAS